MTGRCTDKACLDGPPDDDGTPLPRWTVDGTMLCRRCTDVLEKRLAEVEARRDQLRAVLGGLSATQKGGNKPTKGTPPVPLNLAAHDHLEALHAALVSWSLLVREERGLRGPDRDDSAVLSRWLLGQLDWLVTQPWVDDLADEMRDLSRVADSLTRVRAGYHRKPLPCPECEREELGRWDGDEQVCCAACGRCWDENGYLAELAQYAATNSRLLDRAATATLLGVSRGHLRVMLSRKELVPAGHVDGRPYYDARQVEELRTRRQVEAS